MEDREIVAAIAAGDPAGAAGAYDAYAEFLYGYCRWMLTVPNDAEQVLQDAFMLVAGEFGPGRAPVSGTVRSSLFGRARADCLRRERAASSAEESLGDGSFEGQSVGGHLGEESLGEESLGEESAGDAERAELRGVIRSALAGLAPDEREAVELGLWHNLDDADLAAVLAVPQPQAHALVTRGRSRLEKTLVVALTARTGREACPELARCLEGWDGHLNPSALELAGQHIEHCEVCGGRPGGTLRPEALRRLLPPPALPPEWRKRVLDRCAAAMAPAVAFAVAAPAVTAPVPVVAAPVVAAPVPMVAPVPVVAAAPVPVVAAAPAPVAPAGAAGAAGWERIRRNRRTVAAVVIVLVALAISIPLIAVGGSHAVRHLVAQHAGGVGNSGSAGDVRSQASAETGTGASQSPQPGAIAPVTYLKPSASSSSNVTPSRSPRPKAPGPTQATGQATGSPSASSSDTATAGPTPSRVKSSASSSPSTPTPTPTPAPTPAPTPSPSPVPTSS